MSPRKPTNTSDPHHNYVLNSLNCGSSMYYIPEEIFEMVLDNLDDGGDIQTCLHLFPRLSTSLHKRKTAWYFDQVFPHIFKQIYGDVAELLNCRMVSKRWCKVIDNFWQTHPSNHYYKFNDLCRRTVPYREFSYVNQPALPSIEIRSVQQMNTLCREMACHSGNPFAFGVVEFRRTPERDGGEEFLNATINFLELYGQYISIATLDFQLFCNIEDLSTGEIIFDKINLCLTLLPNVISLGIGFEYENSTMLANIIQKKITTSSHPPKLLKLKAIRIEHGIMQNGTHLWNLLKYISGSVLLKKLHIPLNYWKTGYRETATDISELCINAMMTTNYRNLPKILNWTYSSLLKKLQIRPSIYKPLILNHLFRYLEKFQLEELIIDNFAEALQICWAPESKPMSSMPSIKFLSVYESHEFEFDFLKALSSMTSLHIYLRSNSNSKYINQNMGKSESLSRTVRNYIYKKHTPFDLKLWESLPDLQLLTVEGITAVKQFTPECRNIPFTFSSSG